MNQIGIGVLVARGEQRRLRVAVVLGAALAEAAARRAAAGPAQGHAAVLLDPLEQEDLTRVLSGRRSFLRSKM